MRRSRAHLLWLILLIPCRTMLAGEVPATEKYYYGFELNGALVGYMEAEIVPAHDDGHIEITTRVFAKLTIMEQPFDITAIETCRVDPKTRKVQHCDSTIEQGSMKMGATLVIKGDELHYTPKSGGVAKTVALGADVIVDDPLFFPYLISDFGVGKPDKKNYRVFEDTVGEIQDVTCISKVSETLTLAGREYECAVFEVRNHNTGVNVKIWIDPLDGRFLKAQLPNNGFMYLADPAVVGKIKRAEIDDLLFARAPTAIADYPAISYMKVRATIRSLGERITEESLNVPGQKFTGTVQDNLIDGVFEIEHQRYNGDNAPAFPPSFTESESFKEYLEPELLIESDDPVLVKKAGEITAGARDSWEAACRLSAWVAEEIGYEIPGASARQTFDSRKGECGAHSRLLTAFCRAVGIPTRLVSGCMYTPLYGGSFGQHAWNEIYMGEAGWVTVDSTAKEVDYVDSGHIRLGSAASFNPENMKVLDYKAGALEMGKAPSGMGSFENLPWELGKTYSYRYLVNGAPLGTDSFTVKRFEKVDGRGIYTCSTTLNLQGASASGEWQVDNQGTPLTFKIQGAGGGMEYSINCEFHEDKVIEKVVKAGQPIERTVPLTEKVYLIDNNNLSLFAFLLAGLPREKGQTTAFKVFHPSSMQVLPAQITVKDREQITVGGKEYDSWALDISLAGTSLHMWIDDQGRLLKDVESGGRMVVELMMDQEKSKTENQKSK